MSEMVPMSFHPAEFIEDELEARGWTRQRLAMEIGGDYGINTLAVELYLEVRDPDFRLGSLANDLDRAFGVSSGLFGRLEAAYLATQKASPLQSAGPSSP